MRRITISPHSPPHGLARAAVFACVLLVVMCGSAEAWLDGYDYRQPITLTGNTSGAQTDFQVLLNVTYDAHMQANFSDLRFTNASDGLIDAWLESNTTDYALVWVEFPTTPANTVEQTYYMYYGNVDAASDWNISATFVFGDDFSGDLTQWSSQNALTVITDGVVKSYPTTAYGGLRSSNSIDISSARMMEARIRMNTPVGMQNGVGFYDRTGTQTWYHHPHVSCRFLTGANKIAADIGTEGTFSTTTLHSGVDTNWHRYKIKAEEGAHPYYWYDTDTTTISVNIAADTYYLWIPKAYNTKSPNEWTETDWIFVRKYAANPPTYTFGSEQCSTPTPIDIVNGIYGFLNTSIPANSTIATYKAAGIVTIESTLDWDAITSSTWDSYLASVQYCHDQNRRAAMRLDLGGDYNSSTYRESVKANITVYLPNLTGDPYQSTLQYIVLNLTNASGVNTTRTAFVNEIGQNISEQTGNSFKTMILENLTFVDAAYVGGSPIHYKSLSTVPDWLDFEAETLRGNTSLSRVYSGNKSFIITLTDYRDSILNRMRDTSNITNQYNETYSVRVGVGDLVLFNNGSAKVNRTVVNASSGYYWAAINDTMMNLSAGVGTVGFYIPTLSYDYILKESSLDRITYISDQSSQLWGEETTVDEEIKYHDGIMDASYTWGGDNTDIRAEFWDPTFTRENTFMIHYEWINASVIHDYSVYDYIITADKNANEITNTIARLSDTYGYISVGDYLDTDVWQAGKTAEIDDWCDNFSVNIFLDGIDSATLGINASSRLKDLADHVRDKDKKIIMNTYTYYQEFATYGDAVMKESCFSRWDGAVGSPTYSWENMTIEKERADYYTSHNIPVLGMSFGDLNDYDKLAFDYAAFAILYGLTGNNSYRYGQPNFQAQKEIWVYPLGTMLEPSYTETSSTDWNRLYQAGRVHINPEDHTWWVDDNKEINNLTVSAHFYAGGNFGGGQHVKVFANSNESISTIYYYNGVDPLYTWVWRSCELDESAYADHGHYYVYMYYRGVSGGWNFLGEATRVPVGNVKTWFDTTTQNLPETVDGQTWGGLAGYNWMMNLTINYTTSQYVDELEDRITQTPSTTRDAYTITHTTTISSDRDTAIPVWSGTQNISAFSDAKTYANNSAGNWIKIDVNDVADASAGTLNWNYTTVDGEPYGVVRESRGNDMYFYRFLLPHTSIHTFKTNSSAPVPPDPTNLANSTGNFWVNHTWQAGSGGNTTDSYSVLMNSVWHNGTTDTFWNGSYSAHAWQNITVYAYNASGTGTLSFGNISDSIRIPNNPVTITNTSDWSGEMGGNVSVDYNATDLDNDTITYSCNRTDLFTDFSTTNGTGNWIAAAGTYYIDFGVSDGWGSTDNYTMTIIANATPPDPTTLTNTTGNFWVNHTWQVGSGNVTDSYNVSVNTTWHNTTTNTHYNDTYTPHAWQNTTVFAFNSSGTGTLSPGSVSQNTQIPNNPITITNTSDWSGSFGENVYVDYDATDLDSDAPTFSCNRTDLFTDFDTASGTGNWTAVGGTYIVDFGVSDGWGSTSNYTMTLTVTAPIIITLLSQEPADLYQNSTGTFNQTWGIEHAYPLNNSTITYIYHNIPDSDAHHSLRMPVNDRAPTGWRGDNRNETGANRLTMEGNTTIFGSDIWTWSGADRNVSAMTLVPINSTYTKVYWNCTTQCTVFTDSWYLDRTDMVAAAKTQIEIDKGTSYLIKFFDPEVIAGRGTNYTASFWIDTVATSTAPPAAGDIIYLYWANGSFNPAGGVNIKDSPYSTPLGSLSYTEWLDHEFTIGQSKYIRFDVYAGSYPEILLDNEMYIYFEFDSPKKMRMNVTNAATSTNLTFGETGVMWTGTPTGSSYSSYAYTPNIWMSFHRGNQTFESKLWAKDSIGNLLSSSLEQTQIIQSAFPPTTPSFYKFTFAGYNDTTMDCTYRDNITIWLDPGNDPDGGNTTSNLTLWTADHATCVAIINSSIPGDGGIIPIVFNTTPHYSTGTLYTLKCVITDDETATATRWHQNNFSLSPLATSGAFVDGDRITFWGIDDVPALYTAISDPTAISLSGGIYTFHKAIHHSQYGDLWNVSSDIRIISKCDPSTPFYRITGTDEIDGATILSWNETAGAPATSAEEYRAYLYSDPYYSRINIRNSNISYLGKGISPYRGVYIQNGEGAVIDNNTFLHNGYGLNVINGGNFTITNNTVVDPVGISMNIQDTNGNVSVRDNRVTSDVETSGIQMYGGSGNEFINNTISGVVQSAFYNRYISDSIFRDNTLDSVQFGISLSHGCENITIIDNDIYAKMDVYGHPAWGIMILSGSGHNVSNNVVTAEDGYGIDLWQCANVTMINNSVTTNAGTHPDGGAFVDYLFEGATTGNIIHDPFDTSNSISLMNNGSDVRIENTDNTVFESDGTNHTYAYPTNFSLFADTQEVFNITQRNMTTTPATDRLQFWNLGWTGNVTFNASTDTAGNQVWFNITKATWADLNITVYRNGTEYANGTADASGLFTYNYSGGWSERYFTFVRGNLAPDKPSLVAPANGAVGTSTNPTLRVTVSDIDDDPMNVTFYQQGGTQIGSTQTGIANGSTASVVWSGRSYSTTYYWYAVAHDGKIGTQSDTWHFTTQATGGGGGGGGVSHDIAITGCNDWNGNAGTTAAIDFGYVNEDADAPVFTTNATKGTLNAATGVWTWSTTAGDVGVYNWWFRVKNAYGNSDDCTVTVTVYTADTPLGLGSTTGNFWVDHTWNAVAGASEYRVRVNGVWHNGTDTHYLNTLMSPHGWSNITLASYNTSTGVSSFISDDVQIPNNPITITNYADQNVFVGENVTVDLDYADLDGDTPTFSCSRTDLFTDFSTSTGKGNWTTATNGTFEIDFGVTDGWGSTSNCTVKVRVGERPTLPTTIPISIWITITVLMFLFVGYTLHVRGYVQKIFGGMVSVIMAYIQSQQIVSGNVVQITTLMNSADVMMTEKVEVVIPELAYLLLFVAAIMTLVTSVFIVKYIQFLYKKANSMNGKEGEL